MCSFAAALVPPPPSPMGYPPHILPPYTITYFQNQLMAYYTFGNRAAIQLLAMPALLPERDYFSNNNYISIPISINIYIYTYIYP